jgi:hypothetical protein
VMAMRRLATSKKMLGSINPSPARQIHYQEKPAGPKGRFRPRRFMTPAAMFGSRLAVCPPGAKGP